MTPFSKNPITFGWKQGIKNMTSVTCDSVEKINVRVSLSLITSDTKTKMIGQSKKGVTDPI